MHMVKNYILLVFLFQLFLSINSNAQQTASLTTASNRENRTIRPPPIFYDYGDAPNSYLTDGANGGPIHSTIQGMPEIILGLIVDYENEAFPSTGADGDDLDNLQDDDGINPSDIEGINISSDNFSIDVDYSNSSSDNANLYAWIDFDRSGIFDADEFTSVLDLNPGVGVATLNWSNLIANGVDIIEGISYARFRITTYSLTSADAGGHVSLGEVEDYVFVIDNKTLGVDDEILSEGLNIYPNPVTNILTIDSKLSLEKVEIFNILGQKEIEIKSGFKSIQLNDLTRGFYIIKIYSEKGTTVRKLIKK